MTIKDLKHPGLFAAGVLFGTAGIKALSSKDAKKLYTNCTAAVLRAKKVVMDTVTTIQENAEDIYADAKQINEEREAAEEAVEDVAEETAEEAVEAVAANGVKVMSINLLLPGEEEPVIWRGPVIAGTVKQFWTDVIWGDLDYLFVDMPPGTGDVPLTVFQSLPVDGVVIVSSPQDLVRMIVMKAYKMAQMMSVPVLGIVENYSYLVCPDCGKKLSIFGESHIDEIAAEIGVPVLGKMPIHPEFAELVDEGRFAEVDNTDIAKINI